jgi:hypothetical protein
MERLHVELIHDELEKQRMQEELEIRLRKRWSKVSTENFDLAYERFIGWNLKRSLLPLNASSEEVFQLFCEWCQDQPIRRPREDAPATAKPKARKREEHKAVPIRDWLEKNAAQFSSKTGSGKIVEAFQKENPDDSHSAEYLRKLVSKLRSQNGFCIPPFSKR